MLFRDISLDMIVYTLTKKISFRSSADQNFYCVSCRQFFPCVKFPVFVSELGTSSSKSMQFIEVTVNVVDDSKQ